MELIKLTQVTASGNVKKVWFNAAHIIYMQPTEFQDPKTKTVYPNCMSIRTSQDHEYYLNIDEPVEKKDVTELKEKKLKHKYRPMDEGLSNIAGS